jgi:hypothetical protein
VAIEERDAAAEEASRRRTAWDNEMMGFWGFFFPLLDLVLTI